MPTFVITQASRRASAEGLISLVKRRAWFAEDATGQDAQNDAPDGGSEQQGRIEDLAPWAQTYVRSLRNEAAANRKALTNAENAARQREQQALAEQGNFKTLAEQRALEVAGLTPYKERVDALEALIRAGNEARIKQVPEALRTMIPAKYAPEELSAWLDANMLNLQPRQAPNLDAGAGGGGKAAVPLTDAERAVAARMGLTPEEYAKHK